MALEMKLANRWWNARLRLSGKRRRFPQFETRNGPPPARHQPGADGGRRFPGSGGWCVDAAVINTLAVAEKKEDVEAVQAVVGSLSLGGSQDPVHHAVCAAELAISKGASTLLARKQLNDLPNDLITTVNILDCTDVREALMKAMVKKSPMPWKDLPLGIQELRVTNQTPPTRGTVCFD
jgi:hypothetical protein